MLQDIELPQHQDFPNVKRKILITQYELTLSERRKVARLFVDVFHYTEQSFLAIVNEGEPDEHTETVIQAFPHPSFGTGERPGRQTRMFTITDERFVSVETGHWIDPANTQDPVERNFTYLKNVMNGVYTGEMVSLDAVIMAEMQSQVDGGNLDNYVDFPAVSLTL
jgi:hypothetical protein